MAQRRHHYEHAFEWYLRARRVPYVAVDEARKALIPEGQGLKVRVTSPQADQDHDAALKSFDFVIYGQGSNLLVEVKGRRIPRRSLAAANRRGRLESWVTLEDIHSMAAWGRLFGPDFTPTFLFVYWCDDQPPDALFEETFEHRGKWYALRAITLEDYRSAMRVRSLRWGTVHLSSQSFDRLSRPFAPPIAAGMLSDPPPGPPVFEPL